VNAKDDARDHAYLAEFQKLSHAIERSLLGFAPDVDREDLARRVLDGGELGQHERRLIADLLLGIGRKPWRPKSKDKAAWRAQIAQLSFYAEALLPGRQQKRRIHAVAQACGVSERTVHAARSEIKSNPQRLKHIKASALAYAELVDKRFSKIEVK